MKKVDSDTIVELIEESKWVHYIAVSYTHLDVYTRQVLGEPD